MQVCALLVTILYIIERSAVVWWSVCLPAKTVTRVQSPAEIVLYFLKSTALGLTQPLKNGHQAIFRIVWGGKLIMKGSGHPTTYVE